MTIPDHRQLCKEWSGASHQHCLTSSEWPPHPNNMHTGCLRCVGVPLPGVGGGGGGVSPLILAPLPSRRPLLGTPDRRALHMHRYSAKVFTSVCYSACISRPLMNIVSDRFLFLGSQLLPTLFACLGWDIKSTQVTVTGLWAVARYQTKCLP